MPRPLNGIGSLPPSTDALPPLKPAAGQDPASSSTARAKPRVQPARTGHAAMPVDDQLDRTRPGAGASHKPVGTIAAAATVLTGPGFGQSQRTHFIGRVELKGGKPVIVDPWNAAAGPLPLVGSVAAGTWAEVRLEQKQGTWQAKLTRELAAPHSARAAMFGIAAAHGLDPSFPPAVTAQVAELLQNPGLDDPSLKDLTHLPFITIDNDDSRDLDQAMQIDRRPDGGFIIRYALADASYYVQPGTPLFDEAMRRGTSFYLPGLCIPMLPVELSEGLVSLNEGVDRRALVVTMTLDANGRVEQTGVERARIRSRAKLSYNGVQRYFDAPADSPLREREFTSVLDNLAAVGVLRQRDAASRDVVRFQRRDVRLGFGPDGMTFNLVADQRNEVEKWNEQISLLCNSEGAEVILGERAGNIDLPNLQGIFKVHDAPPEQRLADLRQFIDALIVAHGLEPSTWRWNRSQGESLADYLARLPAEGEAGRLTQAINRQAMLTNVGAEFSAAPGPHFGVGAAAYARLSSPMRELVGIFTHKELVELLAGQADRVPFFDDVALRDQIIALGNGAKKTQNALTKEANKLAIDELFRHDLAASAVARPLRRGTLMGLAPGKAYVLLDDPPIEVKVYLKDLENRTGQRFRLDPSGTTARSADGATLMVGGALDLRILDYDERQHHWVVVPQLASG